MYQVDYEKKTNAGVINTREHILKTIDGTIERLGTTPDLYYLHRRNPDTALEETIGALAEIKKAGKTKYIGLSECNAETLREACQSACACLPAERLRADRQSRTSMRCRSNTRLGSQTTKRTA